MSRIVLITDINTPLGYSLLKLYLKDGNQIIGTVPSINDELQDINTDNDRLDIYEWRRNSLIESKNLLLHITKKYKKLDEAVVIQSIPSHSLKLHELTMSDIDKEVDCSIKGLICICREIIKTMRTQKSGSFFFIFCRNKGIEISPLSELIKRGSEGFLNHLLHVCGKEHFRLNIIETPNIHYDTLPEHIYKTIKEKLPQISGKKIQIQQKTGIFPGINKFHK